MYLAVDIGGTKTLLAAFNENGAIKKQLKFPTPESYQDFLRDLAINIPKLDTDDFMAVGVGVPGNLNRHDGVVLKLGNLSWKNEPIKSDIEKITSCVVFIENDAKLAGFYEALKTKDFKKVLFITFGTGIGVGVVSNGQIDQSIDDSGGKYIMLKHNGIVQSWEEFASGRAIVKKYGKLAKHIDDANAWKDIAARFAAGILDLTKSIKPDVIIIGGGVGKHFDKYNEPLLKELKKYETTTNRIPPVRPASRPEEAVIYGCYELVKKQFGAKHASNAG